MKLEKRVALVTGGASGIGKGIALAFAKEGAVVAVCDLDLERLKGVVAEIEALGARAMGVRANVSKSEDVKRMFAEVVEKYSTVDILVNNAGVFRSHPAGVKDRTRHLDRLSEVPPKYSLGITRHMTDEEWTTMIENDLNSVFYCTREALNIMEERGYGRIINIASIVASSGLGSHSPNYSAAKGGVVSFTKCVAHEVAGSGVCVNGIAPGYIDTPPFAAGLKSMGEHTARRFLGMIPLGRLGTIEEIASLAVYLASEEAGYMVGQIVSPNGGVLI